MAVVIKEVVINTTVNSNVGSGESGSSSKSNAGDSNQELIDECVEQVMQLLRDKNER